jgi:hypothetical protein
MSDLSLAQERLKTLRMSESAQYLPTLVKEAEMHDKSYLGFLNSILEYEQKRREEKKKIKMGCFSKSQNTR